MAWGDPSRPSSEVHPVAGPVPTLLLAGGHTPTPNWGGDGCTMRTAAAFVADPESVVGPDASALACLAERSAPAFEVE